MTGSESKGRQEPLSSFLSDGGHTRGCLTCKQVTRLGTVREAPWLTRALPARFGLFFFFNHF